MSSVFPGDVSMISSSGGKGVPGGDLDLPLVLPFTMAVFVTIGSFGKGTGGGNGSGSGSAGGGGVVVCGNSGVGAVGGGVDTDVSRAVCRSLTELIADGDLDLFLSSFWCTSSLEFALVCSMSFGEVVMGVGAADERVQSCNSCVCAICNSLSCRSCVIRICCL